MEINRRNCSDCIYPKALCMFCKFLAVFCVIACNMCDNCQLSFCSFHYIFKHNLAVLYALVNALS